MTLHFYSPRGYEYVRKMYGNKLPEPRTLRKWYQTIDAQPGFTTESLAAIIIRTDIASSSGKKIVCALMFDEMAIKQHVQYDKNKKKLFGYVDCSFKPPKEDDSLPVASEAFVLMINALNDHWKIPIGYVFTNALTGKEKANIVTEALIFLHDADIKIVSITSDGPPSNLAVAKHLGASYDCLT